MNKRTRFSTQEHVALVFEILNLVPYSHKTTAQAIKGQLLEKGIQRDIRTIQRNLTILVTLRIIDQDRRGKPYGYQQIHNKLTPLEVKESLVLQLAKNHLFHLLPTNATKALHSRFEDARLTLFPLADNVKERQWLKKVMSDYPVMQESQVDSGLSEKLSTALYHNHWLTLYLKHQPTVGHYLMPLGLVQQTCGLLLVTGHHDHQLSLTINTYSFMDIHRVALSTFTFEYPEHFTLKHYMTNQKEMTS